MSNIEYRSLKSTKNRNESHHFDIRYLAFDIRYSALNQQLNNQSTNQSNTPNQ